MRTIETNGKRSEKKSDNPYHTELSDSLMSKSICSANDCTGLIPAAPSSDAELEAYEEMYRFVAGYTHPSDAPQSNSNTPNS